MEFTGEINETLGRILEPVKSQEISMKRNNIQYEKLKDELSSLRARMWINSEFEEGYIGWALAAELYRETNGLVHRREVFGYSGEPCLPFLLYSTREFPAGGWYNFYIGKNGRMYFSYSDGKREFYSPVPENSVMNMEGFTTLVQASLDGRIRERDFSLPEFMSEFRNEIVGNVEKYLEQLDEMKS